MDKEIAIEWVKALRSGKYRQTRYRLCKILNPSLDGKCEHYHCCLGVLLEVCKSIFPGSIDMKLATDNSYQCTFNGDKYLSGEGDDLSASYLPRSLANKIGLGDRQQDYANLNDTKALTFEDIANEIEQVELGL
jgi:hypothetical protein